MYLLLGWFIRSPKWLSIALVYVTIAYGLAFGAEGPTCGEGPHKITILVPAACPCNTQLNSMGDSLYFASVVCPSDLSKCNTTVDQTWSDWPECKGQQVTNAPKTTKTLKDTKPGDVKPE